MTCAQKLAERIPKTEFRLMGFSDRSAGTNLARLRTDAIASEGMSTDAFFVLGPRYHFQAPIKFRSYAFIVDTADLTKARWLTRTCSC